MGTRSGSFSKINDISPARGRYKTMYDNFSEWLFGLKQSGGPVGVHLEAFDEVLPAGTGSATLTATGTIPANSIILPGYSRIVTTFAGASVSAYTLGVSGSTSRFRGSSSNITAADEEVIATVWVGTMTQLAASALTPLVTLDQIATSGAIRLVIPYICTSAPA